MLNPLIEYIKNIPYIHIIFFVSLLVIIIIILLTIVIFVITSYIILKLLKIGIDNSNIFFNKFNKKTQQILDLYGDNKITKIYIIKQPIKEFLLFIGNIITIFKYNDIIKNSKNYHTSFLLEIKVKNGRKFLLLEKNNSINLSDKFYMNSNTEMKQISIKKMSRQLSINNLLKKTKERIGNKKFYSWNISENNCLEFTKSILETLEKYNDKYKKYIYNKNSILFNYSMPEIIIHTFNILSSIMNIIEKISYENLLY
jgi:hypothetical protein